VMDNSIQLILTGVGVFKNLAELDRYLTIRQRKHTENS